MNKPSSVDCQIMWNRLIAVVEEQATTLIRTAFSTSVREAGDLSAGLFDRKGRMIAQAVTAMEYRASAEDIARMSHAHPTYAEAMKEAALAATEDRALHV